MKYIFFRIFAIIPILLIASFAVFALLRLGGTDPVMQYLINSNLGYSESLALELRAQFGLDKSIWQQYCAWLIGALKFDFGQSFMSGRDVANDFLYFLPNTLKLLFCGFLLALAVSVPLGIFWAFLGESVKNSQISESKFSKFQNLKKFVFRFCDKCISIFCLLGVSAPNFWLAFVLIWIFSIQLDILPSLGLDNASSLVMPSICIALMSICINANLIRSNMLSLRASRHIVYAKMRGVKNTKILTKHIFYNGVIPIITAFGMHLGEMLGGAMLIEHIFGIAGIGQWSINAVRNHDFPIIECFVVVLCFSFAICNLLIDLLYSKIDPRIRV